MQSGTVDYTYLQNTTWRLKTAYPVLRVQTVGKSVVGRSLYGLELGPAGAPALLFAGGFLGTDALTGRLLLQWLHRLLRAVHERRPLCGVDPMALLQNRRVCVVPFVNPDGREICARGPHCAGVDAGRVRRLCGGEPARWDANARGVDLTGNFAHRFAARAQLRRQAGIYGPGPTGYGGPAAESEPETAALAAYCRTKSLLQAVALYPGAGQVLWRGDAAGRTAEQRAAVLATAAGYEVEAAVGRLSYTGFRNWFQADFGRPAIDLLIPPDQPARQAMELLTLACLP